MCKWLQVAQFLEWSDYFTGILILKFQFLKFTVLWEVSTRDVHYGIFRGSGIFRIFISDPEYRILFQNNLIEAKWAEHAEV